ncbi:hypothetical protein [Caldifermentibacillus hisashii]|uniref:hypothetical protein n=1 Tax=Caldifermentibacillus hisashii TaxID=996558 RepID=UPI003100B47C
MVPRKDLVVKKEIFSPQKDDENGCRRQKMEFPAQKCRRQEVSSPKNRVFRPKMVTRTGLVTKKWSFSPQKVDENGCRRQKMEFSAQKCRRERVSSPKSGVFRLKKTTRTGLVAKKWSFPHKNADENGCRRQKVEFFASKSRREGASSPKNRVSRTKMPTRKGLVAKK